MTSKFEDASPVNCLANVDGNTSSNDNKSNSSDDSGNDVNKSIDTKQYYHANNEYEVVCCLQDTCSTSEDEQNSGDGDDECDRKQTKAAPSEVMVVKGENVSLNNETSQEISNKFIDADLFTKELVEKINSIEKQNIDTNGERLKHTDPHHKKHHHQSRHNHHHHRHNRHYSRSYHHSDRHHHYYDHHQRKHYHHHHHHHHHHHNRRHHENQYSYRSSICDENSKLIEKSNDLDNAATTVIIASEVSNDNMDSKMVDRHKSALPIKSSSGSTSVGKAQQLTIDTSQTQVSTLLSLEAPNDSHSGNAVGAPDTPDFVPTPPPPPNCSKQTHKLYNLQSSLRNEMSCVDVHSNTSSGDTSAINLHSSNIQHHHHHCSKSKSHRKRFRFPFSKTSSQSGHGSTSSLSTPSQSSPSTTSSSCAAPVSPCAGSKVIGGLKSKKLKNLIHPLDRSIVGIFTLTIFFTILAIVTGAPTVLGLFLLLPVAIGFKKLFLCHLTSIADHEPLSSIDLFWLHSSHITHCVLYVDKGLSVEQLRDVVASRILSKPELARFRSRLVYKGLCQTPYWKYEAHFDTVHEHVLEDEPISSKKCLRKRLIQLMGESLPTDRPLWQIRYASASYCNQVVLVVRAHQTLSQSGLISILTHYLSDSVPVLSSSKPRFGGVTLSINIFRAIIVGPLTFFLWIVWAFTRRHHNYLTRSKEIKSLHWISLDLPRVYRIKQVTRSTLNDVLLSTIAGSIRAYLTTQTSITNPPDLTVSIPVDIKPNTPIESSLVGVNYVLTTSPIPTNTEGAIPRLWEVRHLMEELKTSADSAVMYGSHYLLNRLLPRPVYRFLINLVNRNSSLYVSNIQGPETSLSIGSHRLIKAYYFLSPPSYCSLVYNIFTLNDKLYLSIMSRSKLIPNAKLLSKCFCAQVDLLHSLLSKRRVPGESKRHKRQVFFADMSAQLYNVAQSMPPADPANVSVELTNKLHDIQDELNRLSSAYDMGEPDVMPRYEELKEEFTSLLYEMRRRKSIADYGNNNIMINIENEEDDDNDGELRPPPRRFSVVSIGRRGSIVSSLPTSSRVTPPILSRRSMATSPEPPSSPEVAFKIETEC